MPWSSAAMAMLACVLAAKNATMHRQDTRRSHLRDMKKGFSVANVV